MAVGPDFAKSGSNGRSALGHSREGEPLNGSNTRRLSWWMGYGPEKLLPRPWCETLYGRCAGLVLIFRDALPLALVGGGCSGSFVGVMGAVSSSYSIRSFDFRAG